MPDATTAYAKIAVLQLEIDGLPKPLELARYAASFTVNQIPEAQCVLAVGRSAEVPDLAARIHQATSTTTSMRKARVRMRIVGQYDTAGARSNNQFGDFTPGGGERWPIGGEQKLWTIFEGYFVGFSYQKVGGTSNGKVQLVAHLQHWLVDLGFSSCLSAISHVDNPLSLITRAVTMPAGDAGSSDPPSVLVSSLLGATPLLDSLTRAGGDLWAALKTFLCAMASKEGFSPLCANFGPQVGDAATQLGHNLRALRALGRIEGPRSNCRKVDGSRSFDGYTYGCALPLKLTGAVASGIARTISNLQLAEMEHRNMWDALVGLLAPMFGLDVCPTVDRAIVAAACPGWQGPQWTTIGINDYDSVDSNCAIPRPLRAVVVNASMTTDAGSSNATAVVEGTKGCMGGAWGSKSYEDGDGVVLYRQAPAWLSSLLSFGASYNAVRSHLGGQIKAVLGSAFTDGTKPPPEKTTAEMQRTGNELLCAYAHQLFVEEMLRGRTGVLAGKLRFDIAPGSHVKIEGSAERFLAREDKLASDVYAHVVNVTVEIDCEGRRAGTTLRLQHLRNEQENKELRTSTPVHPLFLDRVMTGAPLLPELAFANDKTKTPGA